MNTSPAKTLRAHGVCLYVDPQSGRMRYRAPTGTLTAALRAQIAGAAGDYEERAAIREFDGGMVRATAEQMAAADVIGSHNAMQGLEICPVKGLRHPSARMPPTPICLRLSDLQRL